MANNLPELMSASPAPGHLALAKAATSLPRWTTEGALAVAGDAPISATAAAIARLHGDLAPVPDDAERRKDWEEALDERMRRLAVKIAPGMSVQQGAEWRAVIVEALSDLPGIVALTAAKRAIHRPMRFLNEVEAVVRELADEIVGRRRLAIDRLEALRADLETPALALPAPTVPPELTPEEIRAMSSDIIKIGLGCGALTQAQIDAAFAEPHRDAA